MAASKQGRTYVRMLTHFRDAVPLVWGSLRLAPINMQHNILAEKIVFDAANYLLVPGQYKRDNASVLYWTKNHNLK